MNLIPGRISLRKLSEQIKKAAEMYAGCVAGAIQKDTYLELIAANGFKEITLQIDKVIIIPDAILDKYLSKDDLAILKQSEMSIRSITVYAEKPFDSKPCCDSNCCN